MRVTVDAELVERSALVPAGGHEHVAVPLPLMGAWRGALRHGYMHGSRSG
jgi:uncharacterized membrane protein